MSVLVWIEQADKQPVSSCWEVLGKGRQLAGELGVSLVALLMGDDTSAGAAAAGTFGADTVLAITSPVLANYRLSAYAAGLKKAVGEVDASVVLTAATTRGRELCAAVACEMGAGMAPDAVDLRIEEGKLVAVRSIYSNNILTDITFESAYSVCQRTPAIVPHARTESR